MQQQDTGIAKLLSAENEAKEIIEKAKSGSLHTNLLPHPIYFSSAFIFIKNYIFFFNHPKKTKQNAMTSRDK